jgi:hypothetical protein
MTDATTLMRRGKSRDKERGINPFYSGSVFFLVFSRFGVACRQFEVRRSFAGST